jgi:hypothetical protein
LFHRRAIFSDGTLRHWAAFAHYAAADAIAFTCHCISPFSLTSSQLIIFMLFSRAELLLASSHAERY